MDYECHITVNTVHAEAATQIAKTFHWKTSEIARDPLLGDKNFFYLTTHDNDLTRMFERMKQCTLALGMREVPVLREKIEAILHDTKKKLITVGSDVAKFTETESDPLGAVVATRSEVGGVLWNGPVDKDGRPAPMDSVVSQTAQSSITLNPQAAWPFPTSRRDNE